jgi:signal transduction histidine kinase
LRDASGVVELEMALPDRSLAAGQRVRLEGNTTIAKRGAAFRLGTKGPVVDNDGVHSMIEKSGAVYLDAGHHPLGVDWFNCLEKYGLEVDYAGPGLPRQKIPDAALFRRPTGTTGGTDQWVNGLEYRCYEVAGEQLPDFSELTAVKSGTVSNFDLGVIPHPEHVGLQFTGYLEVPRAGLYTFYITSDDGSRLFVGAPPLRMEVVGRAAFPVPRRIIIGQSLREDDNGQWAEVEGKVELAREEAGGLHLELSAGGSRLQVEVGDGVGLSPAQMLNSTVRVTGVCLNAYTTEGQIVPGILLVPGHKEIEVPKPLPEALATLSTNEGALPVLTTAWEVHRLKREEAQRGYPARIRGVVTSVLPEHQAFTIQDSTRGIYVVDFSESRTAPPEVGEFLEVEGTTDPHEFAPIVNARQVSSLGVGRLPEPVRPTWDQLMNGSMDAQYVEVQGIITARLTNGVTLRTRGGVLNIELRLNGVSTAELARCKNALVRVRGCLFATWDYVTHQVEVGSIRILNADLTVVQPAPADLFASLSKTPAELLLFDPQAGELERVKVSGQIVYARDTEYFLTQGGHGTRFILKQPASLQLGDLVEVVGFPELLNSGSPILRDSVARRTGHASLPAAAKLQPDDLLRAGHDATRVRVEGLLASVRQTPADQVLEMQSGVRTFVARLNGANDSLQSLAIGSRLELTGVYEAQGGNYTAGQNISAFELLLNSPADVRLLARPPWWTLRRLLIIVGALAFVLAATVLWITQLHRQVEERTAELGQQIQERQHAEQQRAMERERARVARDLHDELGSGLTEISMLATVAESASAPDLQWSGHLREIGDRAGQMVTALDEIVWAMNPKHDSLASLVSYSCLYADRFLKLANIACRLKGAVDLPDQTVNSVHRHEFFLAFKEALTNVVRHSGATEVRLGFRLIGNRLRLSIADNGSGLAADAFGPGLRRAEVSDRAPVSRGQEETPARSAAVAPATQAGSDGLVNMRARLEKLGGRFAIASQPGRGTLLRFYVPLN